MDSQLEMFEAGSVDARNEVRPGYTITAVGVIPDDWRSDVLGNVAAMSSGTTPPRASFERYYRGGSIHWVKTLDLNNSVLTDTDERVTLDAISETSLTVYPIGTVLVAMYGGFNQIGRTGLLQVPAAVNQAITAIQPYAHRLDSEYLLAYLNYHVGYWKTVASSSRKDPNITSQDIRQFPISFGDIEEQRAIGAALTDVDNLIASLDKLIAKKRDMKQGAMQELLTGKRRLAGFSGEWNPVTLGHLFSFKNGLNKGKEFFGEGTPIVNYMDVYGCSGLRKSDIQGRVSVNKSEMKNFDVCKGDVFFTRTSETVEEIGVASTILEDVEDTVFSGFLLRARPVDDSLIDNFKKYCFASNPVRHQIITKATYTTRALTNGRLLSTVSLRLPAQDEQRAIASILSDMDAEIAALEVKREKTRAVKQGMMQELLTGRTRLV